MDFRQHRAEVKGHTLVFPLLVLSCHHCPTQLRGALREDQDDHWTSLGHVSFHTGVGA